MAHGTPDWGLTAGAVTTYQLSDLGELAVRLGSIVTHDRRGDVVFLDDFSNGLVHWDDDVVGGGDDPDLTTANTRSGPYAARLISAVGVDSYASITRKLPYPALSHLGLEYSFALVSIVGYPLLEIMLYDGTTRLRGAVIWDDALGALRYANSGGGYTTLYDTGKLSRDPVHFHTWKLVIDPVKQEYVRLIFNEREHDMSGLGLRPTESYANPRMAIAASVYGRDAGTSTIYVDDVIVTQNEPA